MPSRFDRWKAWPQLVLRVNQYDGASDSNKKNFAIWSKTFKLDDLAITPYLVEVDKRVAKGVRKVYPASTK